MANCCYVTGKASALNVEDLKKFLDVMENEKFMDFDYEETDDWGEGERKTVRFYGDCKWSISSSINSLRYGNALNETTKGLIVEMWSQEPGVGFEEHIIYANGVCLCDDCVDWAEYNLDDYDSLKELNEECNTNFKEEDFVDGFASVGGFEDFETFDDSDELSDEYFNL